MTREAIGQAIIDIIRDIVPDEDCSGLDGDRNLRDQLDLDSMDFLDIVMELRKKYGPTPGHSGAAHKEWGVTR